MKTTTTFTIEGMTCDACVQTVTARLKSIADVQAVDVSLSKKLVVLDAHRPISLAEAQSHLADLQKYKLQQTSAAHTASESPPPSKLKTYKPLITVFLFIFLTSAAHQIYLGRFDTPIFMNHLMAGFFLGLSFFKFLDLKAFAESFSSYDPIAQRFSIYGYVYPFLELLLGLSFVSGRGLAIANTATIALLTATTIGVLQRLRTKSPFQCACLGTSFNLPLSNITVAENLAMIAMALYNLLEIVIRT